MIRSDVSRSVRAAYVLRELELCGVVRPPIGRLVSPSLWAGHYQQAATRGPRVQLPPLRLTI